MPHGSWHLLLLAVWSGEGGKGLAQYSEFGSGQGQLWQVGFWLWIEPMCGPILSHTSFLYLKKNTSSLKGAKKCSFSSYSAASLSPFFSACFLRKANMPAILFDLLVGGWEQVEGMDSSSISVPGRRGICEGSSHPGTEPSAAVWRRFGTKEESTRVGGSMGGLSWSAS